MQRNEYTHTNIIVYVNERGEKEKAREVGKYRPNMLKVKWGNVRMRGSGRCESPKH